MEGQQEDILKPTPLIKGGCRIDAAGRLNNQQTTACSFGQAELLNKNK